MSFRIGHLLKRSTSEIRRLAYLLAIVLLFGVPGIRMETSLPGVDTDTAEIVSYDAEQAQSGPERIEPFHFRTAGWAFRGADAQVVIDRIPERKPEDGFDGTSDATAHKTSGVARALSDGDHHRQRASSTPPLFQLHEALLI